MDFPPTTAQGIPVIRTPESRFESLPGWHWGKPSFFTSKLFESDVRIAYWILGPPLPDNRGQGRRQGQIETLLLTHGEPSWSYLNRRLVPPLLAKGHRVVLFDQVGFGWSDKPVRMEDYTYERHVAWNEDLLCNHLDLHNVTAVFQDWGGIQGLRVAARNPHRFSRLCISNTVFPTSDEGFEGRDYISTGFYDWKDFVFSGALSKPGAIGRMMGRAAKGPSCRGGELSAEEMAAYQAPFPDSRYCAGVKAYPELVCTPPHDPTGRPQPKGGVQNRALWEVFKAWRKPVLLAFAEGDVVLGGAFRLWQAKVPACHGRANVSIVGAGHFVQDGGGLQLAAEIIRFINANPTPSSSPIALMPPPMQKFAAAARMTQSVRRARAKL